ncbi:hypothetical protein Pmani_011675 [Petrolisthes manimaculis]|uniref:Ig-like domain-containing protein n=1 Tax=Petrolisthes manimaculis TaxID=1843537 RepID=A0AAE1Q099_9EUCA|nr:hypothetical protein Pmani_011675 [Petrolisthes manimaculis]
MAQFITITLLQMILGVTQGIRITKLEVPKALAEGDSGILECVWNDEGDHVYSLKWYQGINEFYRWTPLETPEVKTFPTRHFSVDKRVSERGRILVHNVTLAAAGNYRCEVSGEAPTFKTSFSTAQIRVIHLPDGMPEITSKTRQPYRVNEVVSVTCISHGGRPPPTLTFYINQQRAQGQWNGEEVIVNRSTGQHTTLKHFKFLLRPSLAQDGILIVKCVASYTDLYYESSERYFNVEIPRYLQSPPGSQEYVYNAAEESSSGRSDVMLMVVVVVTTSVVGLR